MSKPTKPKKPQQPVAANGIVPTAGTVVGNDAGHSFAKLGDEYLQAAKFANDGFKQPKWPTFQMAFQALENYLKAYLMLKGAPLDLVQNISHDLRATLREAKAKGLVLKSNQAAEEAVMKVSEYYSNVESRYTAIGDLTLVPLHLVFSFVDQVRKDARL